MITDILEMGEQTRVKGQMVVVGSGIAGAELATYLARNGKDVILVESGRKQLDPSIQALNDVVFVGKKHRELNPNSYYQPYLPPELRGVSRVRQFGGTSNVWTGKWKYFQINLPEHPRLRIIPLSENKGGSAARNIGTKAARR